MSIKQETPDQKAHREMVEKIAKNISSLARSVESLLNGSLKRKALVILLAASSGQTKSAVEEVLKALENLEKDWLNN